MNLSLEFSDFLEKDEIAVLPPNLQNSTVVLKFYLLGNQ